MTGIEKKEETTTEEAVVYAAKSNYGWGVTMIGIESEDDSGIDHAGIFGSTITNFKIGGRLVKKARVRNKRGKWLKYGSGFDAELGNDSEITGIEIVGSGLILAVHVKGGQWLNPVHTSDEDGAVLAGNGAVIDAVWIDEI